jgi:outer membrane receptor protein involved in Fe transport
VPNTNLEYSLKRQELAMNSDKFFLSFFLIAATCSIFGPYAIAQSSEIESQSSASPSEIEFQSGNTLKEVKVVNTTPLPGTGVDIENIPTRVQTVTEREIEQSGSINLSDFMNKNLSGVHVNDNQGNPYQMDLNYRGFTASPLLGTPQGISIFMDGVRLNQAFGDIVQWDLIPKSAIKNMTLHAGSNPVFGLNTLGGSISIETKDGRSYQGTGLETGIGDYGRHTISFEHGGKNDKDLSWYFNVTRWAEDGWRINSPTELNQIFSKIGWKNRDTDLKFTYAFSDSRLTGNGLQQGALLDQSYSSVFTKPDQTKNNAHFLNLEAKHVINDTTLFTGNAYYRKTRSTTFNGDLNDESLGQSIYGLSSSVFSNARSYTVNGTSYTSEKAYMLANYPSLISGITTYGTGSSASSTSGTARNTNLSGDLPYLRCIAQAEMNIEPNEKCNGILTSTYTDQANYGFSGQLDFSQDTQYGENNLVVGAAFDTSDIFFYQASQFGYLNADRSITAVNAYADGSQDSEGAFDNRVNLSSKVTNSSLFFTDTLSLRNKPINLTVSARYNDTSIKNTDNITSSGEYSYTVHSITGYSGDSRNSLSGSHHFSRLNPAVGATYKASSNLSTYAGYSESSRAPTSVELGCADPSYSCRLPNSMAGDPTLNQVVGKTWEIGARGQLPQHKFAWNLTAFNTDLYDDILFVAVSGSGGYFKNFGKTRRQGIESGFSGEVNRFNYGLNYTYLVATYETAETVGSTYNSSADADGLISISKGNNIPLMPKNILNAKVGYTFDGGISTNLGMSAVSESYARGNENNQDATGKIPGHVLFDLSTRYTFNKQLTFTGLISNLMDKQYYSSGQLGPAAFSSSGAYLNSTSSAMFYAPGAPRTFWISMRYVFDAPKVKE